MSSFVEQEQRVEGPHLVQLLLRRGAIREGLGQLGLQQPRLRPPRHLHSGHSTRKLSAKLCQERVLLKSSCDTQT